MFSAQLLFFERKVSRRRPIRRRKCYEEKNFSITISCWNAFKYPNGNYKCTKRQKV